MAEKKDWTGSPSTAVHILGASNHSQVEREHNDYYATDPKCARDLLKVVPDLSNIWEPSCGECHLADVFEEAGILGRKSDLVVRRRTDIEQKDFLLFNTDKWYGDIVTNPPYKFAQEFIETAMDLVANEHRVCMFLKLTFLEGQGRRKLFETYPPEYIYVYRKRAICALGGDFESATKSSAVCYAWFVWKKGFNGEPIVRWI